jgi:hypothetical protein
MGMIVLAFRNAVMDEPGRAGSIAMGVEKEEAPASSREE